MEESINCEFLHPKLFFIEYNRLLTSKFINRCNYIFIIGEKKNKIILPGKNIKYYNYKIGIPCRKKNIKKRINLMKEIINLCENFNVCIVMDKVFGPDLLEFKLLYDYISGIPIYYSYLQKRYLTII